MEAGGILHSVLALVFVLALIGLLSFLARKFGGNRIYAARAGKGGEKRLAIVEILPVDTRRRLILLRRDNVEHLVLLSGERDTVIESGIKPGKGRKSE